MSYRKPAMRTYVRKRKETAEEKYDAIFGSETTGAGRDSPRKEDLSKRRRVSPVEKTLSSGVKSPKRTISVKSATVGTASEKFDAVFGDKSCNTAFQDKDDNRESGIECSVAESSSPSNDDDDNTCHPLGTKSQNPGCNSQSMSKTTDQSKYDMLFQKNEKASSDLFDAVMGQSEFIPKPKAVTPRNSWRTMGQLQMMRDLSSFNSWEDSSDSKQFSSPTKSSQSPTKMPSITHASMMKVGGRLVLNIQRGGGANSVIDKGGTLLLSPVTKSSPTPVSQPVSKPETKALSNAISSSVSHNRTKHGVKTTGRQPLPVKRTEPARESSRKVLNFSGKKVSKCKVSYNPRPWASQSKDLPSLNEPSSFSSSQPSQSAESLHKTASAECLADAAVPKLKKSVTWPKNVGESIITSVKCDRGQQEYFTVVRHVKNYQNCLEEGEIQEFEDEILYLQEGLPSSQPTSVRCLSVTSLACKCEQQNFRLYLRAHNVLTKVFEQLQDADQDKALALATSSMLYMLSRDRQIDIDKVTLRILLKLVDPLERKKQNENVDKGKKATPVKTKYSKIYKSRKEVTVNHEEELESVRDKIKGLIDRCGDPLVTSDDLSTKVLASEALLRYTARRTSEWYREEIRLKGGLDHVINMVKSQVDIVEGLPSELDFSSTSLQIRRPLCTLERLLRVLENGIINSARNAMYLVTHQRALLLKKISLLMSTCSDWLRQTENDHADDSSFTKAKSKAIVLLKNAIAQSVKLLVNISNDSEWSSTRIGDQEGLLQNILTYVLDVPSHILEDHRYEIMLVSLGLLVNLVESSAKNRMTIMRMKTRLVINGEKNTSKKIESPVSVVEALVKLFIDREIAARQNEILGEEGVKKAAEAKRKEGSSKLSKSQSGGVAFGDAENEGYWVENEDGMEWVPAESNENNLTEDLPSSQGSCRVVGDPQNIEARLTTEEKAEMKQTLEKATDHMEASIIASYAALVLGCLIHGNPLNANTIRSQLPNDGDLSPMIAMLNKFLSFMNLTHGMSKKGERKLAQVIEDMEELNLKKLSSRR